MVAVLLRLKLSLLRNILRQSVWRIVGLVLVAVSALGAVALVVAGLVAARFADADLAAVALTLGGTALLLGWIILPLLLFGVDETLDPARFALLPLTARQLLPGLLAAAAVGVPGIATIVIVSATVVTWSRGPIITLVAVVAALLGILLCLTAARVVTSAFARMLTSRRYQDLASVLLFAVIMAFALGTNGFNAYVIRSGDQVGGQLRNASDVLAWSPLGWVWSAPADAATGRLGVAATKLVLSAGLLVVLLLAWHGFLARSLVSAVPTGAAGRRQRQHSLLDRVLPDTAVGATAARSLRYLRRDPRYLVSLAGVLIAPLAVMAASLTTGSDGTWLVWMPVVVALLVTTSACQEISFDGSAFWTQMSSGVPGRDDLTGRALATFLWSGPLVLAVTVGSLAWSGRWDLTPSVVALTSMVLIGGVGVGVGVSARWQGVVPPPGSSPFGGNSGGSLEATVALLLTVAGAGAASAPILALVIAANWLPALAWVALLLGPVWGVAVLRYAVARGGRYLDAHWPEVLGRLTKNAV